MMIPFSNSSTGSRRGPASFCPRRRSSRSTWCMPSPAKPLAFRSLMARLAAALSRKTPITALFIYVPPNTSCGGSTNAQHVPCLKQSGYKGLMTVRLAAMRRVLALTTALLLAVTSCARLAQQQDTLAPRVTPPDAPTQLQAPSASSQPSAVGNSSCAADGSAPPCQAPAAAPPANVPIAENTTLSPPPSATAPA